MDLYFYNGEIQIKVKKKRKKKGKKKRIRKKNNCNEDNTNEIANFINSEILTEEKEFSLLNEGISEIENIDDIKELKFNLIYRTKSDKNKIDKII